MARTASAIVRVGAEPVDGLGRKRDELARAQRSAARAIAAASRRDPAFIAASVAVRAGPAASAPSRTARIRAFARACASPRRAGADDAARAGVGMSEFPVHVGIGVGRSSGQGRGPDLRRGARRDSRARPHGTRRGGDARVDRARRDGRRDHDQGERRLRARRARNDPRHRLQRPRAALRRRRLRGDGLLRPAVAGHRAGRRPRVGRLPEPGRRRPGPDVRLRVRRDAGADAVPDLLRASAGAAAKRGAPRRPAAVPASRREVAGHRALRGRQAGRRRHGRAVDAASSVDERQAERARRSGDRGDHQAGVPEGAC